MDGRLKSAYPTILLVIALIVGSIFTAYLIVTVGAVIAPVVVVAVGGLFLTGMMFRHYKTGIYAIFMLAVFMSFIGRMTGIEFPFGIVLDALSVLVFLIMLFSKQETDWSRLKSGITYLYVFVTAYQLLQVFNPNATSYIAWVVGLRIHTSFLLFIAFYHLFQSPGDAKKFTILWIALGAIVAAYGLYQEFFGLNARELRWIYSSPSRPGLYLIWGHMRKFSFLSDPSAYGLFMAFSGLACFVLMMGPFKPLQRIMFGGLALMMWWAMSYSGTRTATAMVAVGLAFYFLITLKSRKTFIVMILTAVAGVGILYGPFYGGTINRIRSTFAIDKDASMNVRDQRRISMQQYVKTHPFGGGVNTTGANGARYSPDHPLGGGWDPDSGYLLTALEIGWVGLLLGMAFFFVVVLKGINNYFSNRDPLVRTLNLTYVVPFLTMTVAHFTQDAMFQKPQVVVLVATYALMLQIPSYDKKPNTNFS